MCLVIINDTVFSNKTVIEYMYYREHLFRIVILIRYGISSSSNGRYLF